MGVNSVPDLSWISEALVRQRKSAAVRAPQTFDAKPRAVTAPEPASPRPAASAPAASSSLKSSLKFLADGNHKHPDFEKHFNVYKQAADRVMPHFKRDVESRGGDPNELESRMFHPGSVQNTARAALNNPNHAAGLANGLRRSAKWATSKLLVAKGSGPEGAVKGGRAFHTKPIEPASERDTPDPRKATVAGHLGRGPQRGTASPDRAHSSVPAANKAERFTDDPKVHDLTSKVMDMSGPHKGHKEALHALLNHIISTRDPVSDEAGPTAFHKKAEENGLKLPGMSTWRPVASRFFKRIKDNPEIQAFLKSSVGTHAESILHALGAVMITESIRNFRLAEQRADVAYANLSEDQLDEIFGGLRGAITGARAGYRAGGLGGAWSGAQLGAARGKEQETRANAANAQRVQRAVSKAMPVSSTERRRDLQFKKAGGPMGTRDVAAMRVAARPEYRHMSMNQVKKQGSPEALKSAQRSDLQARNNAPDEAAAWAKKMNAAAAPANAKAAAVSDAKFKAKRAAEVAAAPANRLARRAAKAGVFTAPRRAATAAKAARIAALSPEARARLDAKRLPPKPPKPGDHSSERLDLHSLDFDYNNALIEGLNRWRKSTRNGVR